MTAQWPEHPTGVTEVLPGTLKTLFGGSLARYQATIKARVYSTSSHLSYDDTMLYFHVTLSLTVGKNIFFS